MKNEYIQIVFLVAIFTLIWFFRYDVQISNKHAFGYKHDRWTGTTYYLRGDKAKKVLHIESK